ncbi:MAG: ABC transporter ATP-binding protein [Nitrospirae bacterium]|nr:ABC transporter ATP-binding protein [Nitrospirota bacterium]
MSKVIRCEDLYKSYPLGRDNEVVALTGINLSIEKGTLTLITGPSGSGKTTLLSIIGTLERPTKGRVIINDRTVNELSDAALARLRRDTMGFLFQDYNLIPRLPAWENVTYPLIPLGINSSERKKRALQLLEMLGLSHRYTHTPEQLSGGERQRLSLARALVNDPEILLLDEPTSNIDHKTAEKIMQLLRELRENGKSIIISSHDGHLLSEADQTFQLSGGRLVE